MRKTFILFFCCCLFANAQKPKGKFLVDSVLVGLPIQFALTFEHNNATDLVFPDSNYNFKPFKLIKTDYFPTKTKGTKSLDSVIYTLVTFEIDSVISLSLPVSYYNSKQKYFSVPSLVYFKKMVSENDLIAPKVKPSTSFFAVPLDFNFPKLFYYLIISLFTFVVLFLAFGRAIQNQFKIFMYYRKHKEFVSQFKKIAKKTKSEKNIGDGLILWKNHLEWLKNQPYSTMTTKEIISKMPIERLDEALKEFDMAIYGGVVSDQMPFAFNVLFDICSSVYKEEFKKYQTALR
jgi:hypothetical protein